MLHSLKNLSGKCEDPIQDSRSHMLELHITVSISNPIIVRELSQIFKSHWPSNVVNELTEISCLKKTQRTFQKRYLTSPSVLCVYMLRGTCTHTCTNVCKYKNYTIHICAYTNIYTISLLKFITQHIYHEYIQNNN